MQVDIKAGRYIIAVSGGVDSVVLLDILSHDSKLDLVVAHFDHGIRADSNRDAQLVSNLSKKYNLPFELGCGNMGPHASEEKARDARYVFLKSIKDKYSAQSIITAHHQDDLIETAFINILRGTGHRGLVSMSNNSEVERPLLGTSKKSILNYAREHSLEWQEDATNQDEEYLRNYIRINLLSQMTSQQRAYMLQNIENIAENIAEKEKLIATISQIVVVNQKINRQKFLVLPSEVRGELIVYWLRNEKVKEIDKRTVERIDMILKTGLSNTKHSIKNSLWLRLDKDSGYFESNA